jgi:hypothetical protein
VDLGPLKPLLPERLITRRQTYRLRQRAPLADLARLAATFHGAAAGVAPAPDRAPPRALEQFLDAQLPIAW